MEQKSAREIQAELARPFAPQDLEWRLQRTGESGGRTYGIAVPFVTNRAIQTRLDDVVGPENWYNDYKPWHSSGKKESQLCGISIYFQERGEWITKWDGAEDTDVEAIKGGLSDSMKRAAVQWGIGRVLYNMDAVFVDVEQKGKSWVIKSSSQPKLDKTYMEMLKSLGLTPAGAVGLQPQLGAQQSEEAPAQAAPAAKTAAQQGDPAPKKGSWPPAIPGAAQQAQPAARENPVYTVRYMRIQPGIHSSSTLVRLERPDQTTVDAFVRGEHPELAAGVQISDVKTATRRQDTVVYNVLESYKIVSTQQQAA